MVKPQDDGGAGPGDGDTLDRQHQDDLAAAHPRCTEACAAMPECAVCRMRKHPRGRDPGMQAASSYCAYGCPGYSQEPKAGHLWPNEWADIQASRARQKERP